MEEVGLTLWYNKRPGKLRLNELRLLDLDLFKKSSNSLFCLGIIKSPSCAAIAKT